MYFKTNFQKGYETSVVGWLYIVHSCLFSMLLNNTKIYSLMTIQIYIIFKRVCFTGIVVNNSKKDSR